MAVRVPAHPTTARTPSRLPRRWIDAFRTTLYVGPAMVGVVLLSVVPLLYTMYMSLTNRNGPFRLRRYEFTGLDNYRRLLGSLDADFYLVVGRTVLYVLICVALFFGVGLILALALNSPSVRMRTLWRTLLIVPWAVPSYVAALIWKFFFNQEFGTINNTLRLLGLPRDIGWLQQPWLAFAAVVIVNVWMSFPFFLVVILGALQSIPREMYEAAEVDGASGWQQLVRITLPLLRPAVMPAMLLSAIVTFQMFATVWLITEGGPLTRVGKPGATEFVMIYVYRQAFRQNFFALGAAFGVLVFLMLFVVVLIHVRLTRLTRAVYE